MRTTLRHLCQRFNPNKPTMSKLITVFGATGNQGGSVIRSVLADPVLSKEYKLRGITRDISKESAKKLSSQGVEMVTADMSSPSSLQDAIKGSHTVFLVTNFWDTMSKDTEVAQGKAVADACKETGVKHLIFSSLRSISEVTGGKLPNVLHFEGKAEVEQYIRDSGIPATFVLAGLFMTGLSGSMIQKRDDIWTLALPVNPEKAKIPVFDVEEDTGKFVKAVITHFPDTIGKRILMATDYLTPKQVTDELAETFGVKAAAVQIPEETFKSFLPGPIAQEMLENMLVLEKEGYFGGEGLDQSHALLEDGVTSWKDHILRRSSTFT
ncbi:NmrA family transcriptional regulator, putative [Talaromyces stipitatus ATCC 10500]|uniref:NmrA family transcriptional regulator, putative n=1 Tax=Talaromyces stipitatus (strain ATCC 10500 / CBS 375.48 / QM 6759 / NRRL 1006) TaxID=441959 RepID=B8MIZ4_TALSN|nr:NmrA family transcriptional regulator, putative [Talaromyces stipitatus ATCC 10500]EED15656.1 NmrA family transcriptional regulator, putative [Talaromyces stipitatus ATCC 10500]